MYEDVISKIKSESELITIKKKNIIIKKKSVQDIANTLKGGEKENSKPESLSPQLPTPTSLPVKKKREIVWI